jgi:arsenate reductase
VTTTKSGLPAPPKNQSEIMRVTIYHNPKCSKSRATLALLEERGIEPRIVRYLEEPPSAKELEGLLKALGLAPRELLRRGEAEYRELDLGRADLDDDALIEAMATRPRLIERPIVVVGKRARIGRPPEAVLELLPR